MTHTIRLILLLLYAVLITILADLKATGNDIVVEEIARADALQMSSTSKLTNRAFAASFTLSFPDIRATNQITVSHYNIIWNGDLCAIKTVNDPKSGELWASALQHSGTSFHVAFHAEQYRLFTKERNRVLNYDKNLTFDTNASLLNSKDYTVEEIYLVGDDQPITMFEQFRWSTGRGFSTYLAEVLSKRTNSETKLLELDCLGSCYGGVKGRWRVAVDLAADNLIREACFTPDGYVSCSLAVSNSGVMECGGVKLASSAQFHYYGLDSHYNMKLFEIIDLKSNTNIVDIVARFGVALPPGKSEIIDFTKSPPERIPVRN